MMDECQVRVLQKHLRDIVEGVHMEEKLLSSFLERDVFTVTMVEAIRAGRTDSERLYEMMTLLMKRGPQAFDSFIDILSEDYEWLARRLQNSYLEVITAAEESKKEEEENKRASESSSSSVSSDKQGEEPKLGEVSIKPQLSFDLSKQPMKRLDTNYHLVSGLQGFSSGIQNSLNQLYIKVKTRNDVCSYRRGNTEISTDTPEPISFKKIDTELDDLFQRMDEIEHRLKQINGILGMTSHYGDNITMIVELQRSKRELEKQVIQKTQQKNKYCDRINKLESSCRDQNVKVDMLERELQRLTSALNESHEELSKKDEEIHDLQETVAIMEAKLRLNSTSRHPAQRYPISVPQEIKKLQDELKKVKKENKKLKMAQDSAEIVHSSSKDRMTNLVRERAEVSTGSGDQPVTSSNNGKTVGFSDPLEQISVFKSGDKLKQETDSKHQRIDKDSFENSKPLENGIVAIKPTVRNKRSRDTSVTKQQGKESTNQNGASKENGAAQSTTNKHKSRLVSRILSKKRH